VAYLVIFISNIIIICQICILYYKMTFYSILLSIIFILVIASTLMVSCNSASPYYADTIFQKHSKFENFANNANTLDYSSKDDHAAMDTYKPFLISTPAAECKTMYGFNGLFCGPTTPLNPIDKFGNTEGKIVNKDSSGLSNSKGGLSLSDEQKKLLSTRGGNITFPNSDIGQ
jgi:hypothetical protein